MNKPAPWFKTAQVLTSLSLVLLVGCASGPDSDPRDPLEPFNRSVYKFNDVVDRNVMQPVARGYNWIMPDFANRGVTNFFNNLEDVKSAVNNLLQFKIGRAASDVGRVAINSTVGLLGFLDVASNVNLPRYDEDFGQTMGVWGIGPGPYLVLPFFGPSSTRDGVGVVVDWFTDPVMLIDDNATRWSIRAVDIIDTRADLLNASRLLEQAALDPYSFIRDAYLQRREGLVYDGNPPLD